MSEKSNLRQIYDLLSETYPTATNIVIEAWPGGIKADVTTREHEFSEDAARRVNFLNGGGVEQLNTERNQ